MRSLIDVTFRRDCESQQGFLGYDFGEVIGVHRPFSDRSNPEPMSHFCDQDGDPLLETAAEPGDESPLPEEVDANVMGGASRYLTFWKFESHRELFSLSFLLLLYVMHLLADWSFRRYLRYLNRD